MKSREPNSEHVASTNNAAKIKRLQRCINDLISVLALPAIAVGRPPSELVHALVEVLVGMLRLDFAYARLGKSNEGRPIEVTLATPSHKRAVKASSLGEALQSI